MIDRTLTESHQEKALREMAQEYLLIKSCGSQARAAQLIAAADEIKALRAVLLNMDAQQKAINDDGFDCVEVYISKRMQALSAQDDSVITCHQLLDLFERVQVVRDSKHA